MTGGSESSAKAAAAPDPEMLDIAARYFALWVAAYDAALAALAGREETT